MDFIKCDVFFGFCYNGSLGLAFYSMLSLCIAGITIIIIKHLSNKNNHLKAIFHKLFSSRFTTILFRRKCSFFPYCSTVHSRSNDQFCTYKINSISAFLNKNKLVKSLNLFFFQEDIFLVQAKNLPENTTLGYT